MSWNPESIQNAMATVLQRASVDATYRELALRDPAAAVKEATGVAVPAGFKLRFVDNQGADLTLVLPALQKAGGELSDEDLEKVAGGKGGGNPFPIPSPISPIIPVPGAPGMPGAPSIPGL